MTLQDATEEIGPELWAVLDADNPHAEALQRCDWHAAEATDLHPAWMEIEHALEADRIEEVRAMVDALDWRDAIQRDPIPPWSMRAALERIDWTQAELAKRVGVDPRTVRRWLAGSRACTGASATAVRLVLEGAGQN